LSKRVAMRGVARMAWESGLIYTEAYARIKSIPPDPGGRLPAGRHVAQDEIGELLEACGRDRNPAGQRDAAVIAVMAATGLRRAEVCSLQMAQVDMDAGAVRVIGKRNKERLSYMGDGALEALQDWLSVRGPGPGPLFCSVRRDGTIRPTRPLSTIAVNRMLDRRATEAGVVDVTPHDLRRTFVSEALDAGGDIATVAALAGHASVATTQRYDRRGEATKKRVAALVKVPYRRKPR
jgi:integrase